MYKEDKLKNWLILNRLHGLNIHDIGCLTSVIETDEHIFKDKPSRLKKHGFSVSLIQQIRELSWAAVEAELKWAQENLHHVVTWVDEDYPKLLREISAPPLLLMVWGDKTLLNESQLAMVGSRTPTPIGLETAKQFAEYLAQYGLVITSGLARGIDAASHEGALSTGETIAVLGTGLAGVYPKENEGLAQRIAENGAVISEFPLETPPARENFPRRNRIISGLSLGTLVIEAALRSGSLITAKLSGEQGREILAIPGSIHSPLSHGCHKLIREGAKLVETAQDILDELRLKPVISRPRAESKKNQNHPLDEQHQKLLCCIEFGLTAMDVVIRRSGLTPEIVSPMLLQLELCGFVKTIPGGYCRVK